MSPSTILVAGGTGALGQHVVRLLHARGHRLRVLSRSAERGRALAGLADELRVADATRPADLAGICHGVDVVFSCLGQSVGANPALRGPGYHAIDYVANHNLLAAARAAGVRRFVYVSVFGADRHPEVAYLRAHAAVAEELRASGLGYAIVQPTGYFSAYREFLELARRGQSLVIGDGRARTNPIHDEDLAAACVAALERPDNAELPIGGPEVLTRREVLELAHSALGTPPRLRFAPAWAVRGAARLIRPLAPRLGELAQFLAVVSTSDFVAPAHGERRLGDYFREAALAVGGAA
jgi:uncharacterized protein YbjT (DUF2867 family)